MFQRLEAEFHGLEVGMQRLENHYQQWPSGVATWQILGDRLSPLWVRLALLYYTCQETITYRESIWDHSLMSRIPSHEL